MQSRKLWTLGWVLVAGCCLIFAGCGDNDGTVAPTPQPETDTTPPMVPTGLAVELVDGDLQVTWTPNSEADLSNYVLQRRIDEDGVWIQLAADTTVEYTDSYRRHVYYRVRAVDTSENLSAYSTPKIYLASSGGNKIPAKPLDPK